MSVTFWCSEAPRHTFWCEKCMMGLPSSESERQDWFNGLSFMAQHEMGCECCDYQAGTSISDAPEANFSNGNAADVLRMIGLYDGEDCCGTMKVSNIPDVFRKILRAKNINSIRNQYTSDAVESVGERGCVMIEFSVTDDSILRRLCAVEKLLEYAIGHKYDVSWG